MLVDDVDAGIGVAFDEAEAGRGDPVAGGDGPLRAQFVADKFPHVDIEVVLDLREEMDLVEEALLTVGRLFGKTGAAHFESAVKPGAGLGGAVIRLFVARPRGEGPVERSIFGHEPRAEFFLEKFARAMAEGRGLERPEEEAVFVLDFEHADGRFLRQRPAGVGAFRGEDLPDPRLVDFLHAGLEDEESKGDFADDIVGAGDAVARLHGQPEGKIIGKVNVDALLLQRVDQVKIIVEAGGVDFRRIIAAAIEQAAVNADHVDAELGEARRHEVHLLFAQIGGRRARVDRPETDGPAVAELEEIAASLDKTGLARFVFVERAEIEQRVFAEGFRPRLEGPPARFVRAELLAGLELAVGGEGGLGKEEAIEAAVVVIRAVKFEREGVWAGVEGHRSDLDPGDETKVGLAVVGDVDQVGAVLEVDRHPVAAVELVIELRVPDGIGANPERIISRLRGIEAVIGAAFPRAEIGNEIAAGKLSLVDRARVPGMRFHIRAGGVFAFDPDEIVGGENRLGGKRHQEESQAEEGAPGCLRVHGVTLPDVSFNKDDRISVAEGEADFLAGDGLMNENLRRNEKERIVAPETS